MVSARRLSQFRVTRPPALVVVVGDASAYDFYIPIRPTMIEASRCTA